MRKSGSRKRILFLVGGFKLGGTEKHLSLVLPRLDVSFWDIHVRMLGEDGALSQSIRAAGLNLTDIQPEFSLKIPKIRAIQGFWSQIRQVSQEISALNPFAVHCFLQAPAIVGWLACRLTPVSKILILSKRNQICQDGAFPGEKWLERRALRSADHVLGHSSAVVNELKTIGISPEKIHLIPNGIDLKPFSESPGRAEMRAREGWPPQAIVFVVLANLIPYKGHADLLKALKGMGQDDPVWKVVLIGSGHTEWESYLRNLTFKLDLSERVVFCGQRSNIPEILSAADIGVLPSRHEGFSNALLEYMAAGLPVVATDVGGNPDAVVDGETGFLVPPGFPDALSKALERMRLDAGLRTRMGRAGLSRVSTYFNLPACVSAYEKFYRSLIN